MQTVDWFWILHSALAVVLIYPLIGMVLRLGVQTRQRRVEGAKHPPTTGRDHADLGQWLAAGVVCLVLVALTVVIATKNPPAGFEGGSPRALQLLLGSQPEVFRLSDDPLSAGFWQSHYWAGVSVVGLMLFSLGSRPEILRELRWRRLHLSANILAAVLFVVLGLTGTHDLLEIPLSWQKATVFGCDFERRVCPPPAPPFPPAPPAPLAPAS